MAKIEQSLSKSNNVWVDKKLNLAETMDLLKPRILECTVCKMTIIKRVWFFFSKIHKNSFGWKIILYVKNTI